MIPLKLPRFQVTYQIDSRQYEIFMRSPNAAHIWRAWDRPGAKLIDVCEVNSEN